MGDRQYTVRASHCHHRASEEEIYEVLKRTTDPLERSWKKLEKARRIALKFNMIKPPGAHRVLRWPPEGVGR